jgi:hypothetical protein
MRYALIVTCMQQRILFYQADDEWQNGDIHRAANCQPDWKL